MSRRRRKSAEKSPGLVVQPHGGAIHVGGVPGNRGGSGRPPSAIRKSALDSLDKRLAVAEQIADDEKAKGSDRIAALRLLASIGFGSSMAMTEVREKLQQTLVLIEATVDEKTALQLILDIRRVWTGK